MNNIDFKYDSRLDTLFLAGLYDKDYDHVTVIFDQFLRSYPEEALAIEKSYDEGNIDLFRRQIHKIKPTFGFVGLTRLTEKACIIEKACNSITQIETLRDMYHDFKKSVAELIPVVEADLK